MDLSELLKTTLITGIEMHAFFLVLIVMLYFNMCSSFTRNSRKKEHSLDIVYLGSVLMILSDCLWSTVSGLGGTSDPAAYAINMVYFLSNSTAALCWFLFCANHLDTELSRNKTLQILASVPFAVAFVLYLLSPRYGLIFSIENGAYVRGSLFYIETLIKMGYIVVPSVMAIVCGCRKEHGYLRKKDFALALFGTPVIIAGILQTVTGVDFNCLGVTFGLILIFVTGISNQDSQNTDAIYSLANSFEASYIVNMDTGTIRPLHRDTMHDASVPGMTSMDYMVHFNRVLSGILLPEDRDSTLKAFDMENVKKRFKIDNAFSIRYRVRESAGRTSLHTASFIRASGNEGQQEFLLGINAIHSDSLLYERNELLSHENQRLEQINASIIESVAKIVEARDSGSGEHIVRVKKLTELIAREIMTGYPEFDLNEEKVKLISSASVLHDVGKIVIPDVVLLKPGRLTEDEFRIMKTHSTKGCDVLNLFPLGLDDAFLEYALSICRWHHEKYDGKGYPDGLEGEEIPIAAQIVSVADCFDALVSDRPYKKAFSPEEAFDMIRRGECGVFSPKIIDALERQKSRLFEQARLYR